MTRDQWCLPVSLVLILALALSADAQNPAEFERVLVPVSISLVPGAYETVWSTEMWYRNNSGLPVVVYPLAISDAVPSIGRTVRLPIGVFPADAPGQFLFVSRAGADDVQFDLRLFNRADPRGDWGTKIPVVREREFAEAVNLINVPTSPELRSALRVYGLPDESAAGEAVRLTIYAYDERLLVDTLLPFTGIPRYSSVLSLAEAFPEIREVERVRVHVQLVGGATKIWAFVSVVSNVTQNVSLVTPE